MEQKHWTERGKVKGEGKDGKEENTGERWYGGEEVKGEGRREG